MSTVLDMDPLERFRLAEMARQAHDIPGWTYPPEWNTSPCPAHEAVDPLCRRCGILLRRHQRVGATWLYMALKGLLADQVGLGKTAQAGYVIAMARWYGELGAHARVVVVAKPAAIGQWRDELKRMMPRLRVITADGTVPQRQRLYVTDWEVCIISPQTLSPARGKAARPGDVEILERFPIGMLVYDDTDAMRRHSNRQSYAICRLASQGGPGGNPVPRVYGMHGTSLQKRLTELHSFLMPIGADTVFGTEGMFKRRYVTQARKYWTTKDQFGRNVLTSRLEDSGIKNEEELRALLAPMVLRRRASDVDDISIPSVVPSVVWLDPSPAQSRAYEELRQSIPHLLQLDAQGETVGMTQAHALWTHGWQICSGLATLGHDDSPKLDWVEDMVTGDLEEEKVIVFINFKPNVQAMSTRLTAREVGNVIMWGDERSPRVRQERLEQFREDPACRVLIGTTTIEASLNLQVARHVIAVDTIPNPARMGQIVGRAARAGSAYQTVYLHQLLLRGTQEEYLPAQLAGEQAMADTVWGERGDLFQERTPGEILRMIAGRAPRRAA